jgi:hypothetical protein
MEKAMKAFVTCYHTHEKYRLNDQLVELRQDRLDEKWYWYHPTFGCSKSYEAANDAIYGMLHDHACYGVRITLIHAGCTLTAKQLAILTGLAADIHEKSWEGSNYTKDWETSCLEAGMPIEWAELIAPYASTGHGEIWDWSQNATGGYPA